MHNILVSFRTQAKYIYIYLRQRTWKYFALWWIVCL